MKFKQYIKEEYAFTFQGGWHGENPQAQETSVEVFKNPKSSELPNREKEFRAIWTGKDLYLWAGSLTSHVSVARQLKRRNVVSEDQPLLHLYSYKRLTGITIEDSRVVARAFNIHQGVRQFANFLREIYHTDKIKYRN